MSKPEENPPKPSNVPFDDSEFFTSENITDEEEKTAIRDRARVARYVNWRTKKETEAAGGPKPDDKPGKRKKWYKNE